MTAVRCAAAVSQHPEPSVAMGEVIGDLLGRVGPHPDVAVLLVSGQIVGSLAELVAITHSLLAPEVLVGSAVPAVFGSVPGSSAGVMLWAARVADHAALPRPYRLDPGDENTTSEVALVFGATDLTGLDGPEVTGCVAADLDGPGLVLDRSRYADGAVGVLFSPGTASVIDVALPSWEEMLPQPDTEFGGSPFFDPVEGVGLLLFAKETAIGVIHARFDVELALERFTGAVAGAVASATWPAVPDSRPPMVTHRPDSPRLSGLVLH